MADLFLSNLTLSHFRSHLRSAIAVDARPVAIHGNNGAGKTNILEAISLLSPGRGLRRASAQDMTRRPEALGWKVNALINGPNGVAEIDITSEQGVARQVRIDGKPVAQTALSRIVRVLWLIPSMDRLWIEGADGRRRFLDRVTLSFLPDHADISLSYEKAMRERNRLLKDMVREPSWYAALEARLAETGIAIHHNRLRALQALTVAQEMTATAFPVATLALECDMPDNVEAMRVALSDNRIRDMSAGRTLIGPHRADLIGSYAEKGIPARDCSTGEQKALLVSLILANARAVAADFGAPPLLLLDEIAAHLDAYRRAALYDEISALGAQAWMTGTESGLFEAMDARAQSLTVTEVSGVSSVLSAH
ncbi:DNA replication/repair protein RecF [uncultured Sulfitobacter sp.]|uniref:DNA replication/repair protein RecF n=1 Tax=uncultured Sulfitobacter sp. TaxID=191468 RepID=UPI002603926C|nr:DNA replication/repair protein RecF [uncultured Sulfitobacter sp.]